MLTEKIKESYRKAAEEVSACSKQDLSKARLTRRYLNFVRFVEGNILPETRGDKRFRAEVLKDLGYFQDMVGETKKAIVSLNKAEKAFIDLNDKNNLVETQCLLGDVYRSVPKFSKAIFYYKKVTSSRGKSETIQKARANAYWGIGDIHRLRGDYKDAINALNKAERIFIRNNPDEGIGEVLWTRGYVFICRGSFEKAEPIFLQILSMCDSGILDETHRCTALGALADVYRLQGKIDDNLFDLYRQADESLEAQEDFSARSWILTTKALAYMQISENEEAKRLLLEADAYNQKACDQMGKIWTWQALGELSRVGGDIAKAKKYFNNTKCIAKSNGCKLELAHSYLGLAETAKSEGKRSAHLYNKALGVYKEIGTEWGKRECEKRMSSGKIPHHYICFP